MDNTNTVGTLVKAALILDAVEVGPQDLADLVDMTGLPAPPPIDLRQRC